MLKRDASQIGINAREAVKFLDRVTSGKDTISEESIQLQGPDEQYGTWQDVEAQLIEVAAVDAGTAADVTPTAEQPNAVSHSTEGEPSTDKSAPAPPSTNALSRALLDKLNFAKESEIESAASTPPTSPALSNLQSSKTSPEVSNVHLAKDSHINEALADESDSLVVPHPHRPLINAIVFLTKKMVKYITPLHEVFVLTNDNETNTVVRNFGLNVKNIYQLRAAISMENQEAKNQNRYQKKHSPKPSLDGNPEPKPKTKTLFSYDDGDDDEVVFRPRGGHSNAVVRGRGNGLKTHHDHRHSSESATLNPDVPVQEIDPDSFDRGVLSRARPSTADSSNTANGHQLRGGNRGHGRGAFSPSMASGAAPRGNIRGMDRGSTRGRGKLFVP